ncbi:hypothetical protein STENM327S_04861 [Streptomyces tendae]
MGILEDTRYPGGRASGGTSHSRRPHFCGGRRPGAAFALRRPSSCVRSPALGALLRAASTPPKNAASCDGHARTVGDPGGAGRPRSSRRRSRRRPRGRPRAPARRGRPRPAHTAWRSIPVPPGMPSAAPAPARCGSEGTPSARFPVHHGGRHRAPAPNRPAVTTRPSSRRPAPSSSVGQRQLDDAVRPPARPSGADDPPRRPCRRRATQVPPGQHPQRRLTPDGQQFPAPQVRSQRRHPPRTHRRHRLKSLRLRASSRAPVPAPLTTPPSPGSAARVARPRHELHRQVATAPHDPMAVDAVVHPAAAYGSSSGSATPGRAPRAASGSAFAPVVLMRKTLRNPAPRPTNECSSSPFTRLACHLQLSSRYAW